MTFHHFHISCCSGSIQKLNEVACAGKGQTSLRSLCVCALILFKCPWYTTPLTPSVALCIVSFKCVCISVLHWLRFCMMLFVLPEARLPVRDTKGFSSRLRCRGTLLIWMLICYKHLLICLNTPRSWTGVNLCIVLCRGSFSLSALHFSEALWGNLCMFVCLLSSCCWRRWTVIWMNN